MTDVAAVGYGEAEEVDEVEAYGEGKGLALAAFGLAVDLLDEGDEGGRNGEGGEDEDEHGCGETVGEEGGEEVGDDGDGKGKGEGEERERVFVTGGLAGEWGCGGGRGGRGGLGGKEFAEEGFAEADDKDEVEGGDDEVVGGDVEVGFVVHAYSVGYGSHVGDAAGVDAYGHGTDLCEMEWGAVSTEEEVACDNGDEDGGKTAESCFEGFACGPVGEAAGHEHEGYGEGYADLAYEVVGVEESGLAEPGGEVGDEESDDVEDGHGADFVYPCPAACQQHDGGRGEEEVDEVEEHGGWGVLVGLFAGGFEFFFEVLPGAVVGLCSQLFGCALEGDVAAFASAFGTHVDNPVGHFDDVHVVLDDKDAVAAVDKLLEDVEEDPDVLEVEPCGGFVEDVEGVACFGASQFGGEFDALGFTAAEGGGLLSEGDVAEAYVLEGFEFAVDFGVGLEEGDGFVDGHVEYVGDAFAFVAYFEGFAVVAFAVAYFAVDVHVGHLHPCSFRSVRR